MAVAALDGALATRPDLAGTTFNLADMFLFPLIWLMRLKPENAAMLQASPHLVAWYDRIAARRPPERARERTADGLATALPSANPQRHTRPRVNAAQKETR